MRHARKPVQDRVAIHFFLTSKPYSYASEVSQALLFYLALPHSARGGALGAVAAQALVMWLLFNWLSDRLQRNPGRLTPSWPTVLAPLSVAAVIAGVWSGARGLAGVAGHVLTIRAYAFKALPEGHARGRWLGPLGPVFRGITVCGQFGRVWALTGGVPSAAAWYTLIVLATWHIGRNLIGDVRDVRTDTHELPAQWGAAVAAWVFRAVNVAVLAVLLNSSLLNRIPAALIVLVSWAAVEMLQLRFRGSDAHLWGYVGHRLLVLTAVATHLVLSVPLGLPLSWVLALAAAAVLLNVSYYWLPGKDFSPLGRLF